MVSYQRYLKYKEVNCISLDPYLFLLCAEILVIPVKQNTNIVTGNGKEHKRSQYADGTTLAFEGLLKFIFAALDTIE